MREGLEALARGVAADDDEMLRAEIGTLVPEFQRNGRIIHLSDYRAAEGPL